ncbi:permease family protein [Mycobacterium xenopi 4042]|uniref:Permease family protein n=1 Tax=Mycobacterium xenopi 4042 TaxID=1299334 RepID=X8BIP6_MYCXE|nr:permease family protein [Mycobacterium xenopi 4042]
MSFISPQLVTTVLYGQPSGTYDHYFRSFLRPEDVLWSFVEAVIIAGLVMLTHCYYGYTASGGRSAWVRQSGGRCGSRWSLSRSLPSLLRWRSTASTRTST